MFAQFFQLQSTTILAIKSHRHTLIISGLLTGFTCGSLTRLLKLRQFGTVPKTPHNCVKLRGSTNGCFYKHFPFSQKHRFPFCPSGSCAISKSKFVKYLNQQNFCQLNGCLVNSKVIHVYSLFIFLTADRSTCLKRRSTWIISLSQNNFYPDNQKQDHFKHCI